MSAPDLLKRLAHFPNRGPGPCGIHGTCQKITVAAGRHAGQRLQGALCGGAVTLSPQALDSHDRTPERSVAW